MMDKEAFAALLDDLLHRERLPVAELAKRIGVGGATIYSWLDPENSKMPNGRNLIKLAKALNAPELGQAGDMIEQQVTELLLDYARRIVAGQGGVNAMLRVLPDAEMTPEEAELLNAASSAQRAELNAAAGGDFESLPEAEQRRIADRLVRRHEARALAARRLPPTPGG